MEGDRSVGDPDVGVVDRVRSELVGAVSAGVFLLAGGWLALDGDPRGAAAAVILWTAALAMAGLGFGRPAARPGRETAPAPEGAPDPGGGEGTVASARRRLDLSERIGIGPLGGLLGGAAVAVAAWVAGWIGLVDLLAVDAGAGGGIPGLGRRLWVGAVWGLIFGVFYPRMPGRSPLARGAAFSLIPAVWALLVEYPILRGQGWAGVELGELTFVLVLLFHLVWGLTAGTVFQWAELTSDGPLDRPLGAPS